MLQLVTGIRQVRFGQNVTQPCGHIQGLSCLTDSGDFQKNKMAARIQNGRRLAKNANFGDILASKLC